MKRTEAGQVLPLTAILAALLLTAVGLGLGLVRNALYEAARAQTAADASALAGADAGEKAARAAAAANDGLLIEFTTKGADVIVTARVGSSEARARAHRGF